MCVGGGYRPDPMKEEGGSCQHENCETVALDCGVTGGEGHGWRPSPHVQSSLPTC